MAASVTMRAQWHDGAGATPPEAIQRLMRSLHIGWWGLRFGLYGSKELINAKFTFGIHAPQKLAGCGAGFFAAKQRRQQPLQPVGAGARTNPTVEIGGVQVIGVQLKGPSRWRIRVRDVDLGNLSSPFRTKAVSDTKIHGAQAISPFEPRLTQLQRLVQASSLQDPSGQIHTAIPTAARRCVVRGPESRRT